MNSPEANYHATRFMHARISTKPKEPRAVETFEKAIAAEYNEQLRMKIQVAVRTCSLPACLDCTLKTNARRDHENGKLARGTFTSVCVITRRMRGFFNIWGARSLARIIFAKVNFSEEHVQYSLSLKERKKYNSSDSLEGRHELRVVFYCLLLVVDLMIFHNSCVMKMLTARSSN